MRVLTAQRKTSLRSACGNDIVPKKNARLPFSREERTGGINPSDDKYHANITVCSRGTAKRHDDDICVFRVLVPRV